MNIALCISGQLRNFKDSLNYWNKFLKYFQADLFISTWSKVGYDDRRGKKVEYFNDYVCFDYLKNYYVNLIDVNIYEFKKEYHYQIDNVVLPIEVRDSERKYLIPMYFLIYDCNKLSKEYELKNDFQYDIVIRARPDRTKLLFDFDKLFCLFKKSDILWYAPKRESRVSDKLAFSCRQNVDYYCNIFKRLNSYFQQVNKKGGPKKIGAEYLMQYHLNFASFKIKPYY